MNNFIISMNILWPTKVVYNADDRNFSSRSREVGNAAFIQLSITIAVVTDSIWNSQFCLSWATGNLNHRSRMVLFVPQFAFLHSPCQSSFNREWIQMFMNCYPANAFGRWTKRVHWKQYVESEPHALGRFITCGGSWLAAPDVDQSQPCVSWQFQRFPSIAERISTSVWQGKWFRLRIPMSIEIQRVIEGKDGCFAFWIRYLGEIFISLSFPCE
jgi:hypothetical protein